MWIQRQSLHNDYDNLLSDMLHIQYRVEVLRRKMQVEQGREANFGTRLQITVDESISELVKIGNCDELAPKTGKAWWER